VQHLMVAVDECLYFCTSVEDCACYGVACSHSLWLLLTVSWSREVRYKKLNRDFGHQRVAGSNFSIAGEQNNTSLDRRQSRMSRRRTMHNFYISRHMQTEPFPLP
jgi:hypothetical protein